MSPTSQTSGLPFLKKLGLADCQSTYRIKQHAHIFLVMTAYAQLELMKNYKTEKITRRNCEPYQTSKITQRFARFTRSGGNFHGLSKALLKTLYK